VQPKRVMASVAGIFTAGNRILNWLHLAGPEGVEKPGIPFDELWDIYTQNVWLRSVIDSLDKDAARIPWDIVPNDPTDKSRVIKDQIDTLKTFFKTPNWAGESFGKLISMSVKDILVMDANGIEIVTTRGGEPVELYSVSGSTLKPDYSPEKRRVIGHYHAIDEQGVYVYFPRWKDPDPKVGRSVFASRTGRKYDLSHNHFTYLVANPMSHTPYGLSPVESVTLELATNIMIGKKNCWHFLNGQPDGQITGAENETEARRASEYWEANYKGPQNWGKTPVMYAGMEYKPFPEMKAETYVELQRFLVKAMCAIYGTNDAEVAGEKTENRSTAEQRHEIYKNRALGYILSLWEYEMNTSVVPLFFEKPLVRFKFGSVDYKDLEILSNIYGTLLDRSVVTINETRARLNLGDPVGWGDAPFDLKTMLMIGYYSPPDMSEEEEKALGGGEWIFKTLLQKDEAQITLDEIEELSKMSLKQVIKENESELAEQYNLMRTLIMTEVARELRKLSRKGLTKQPEEIALLVTGIMRGVYLRFKTILGPQAARAYAVGFFAKGYGYGLPGVDFSLVHRSAINFLRSYTSPYMLRFCSEMKRNVLDTVMHGIDQGLSTDQIAYNLKAVIDGKQWYYKTVARSEALRANNYGALDRYERYTQLVDVLDGDGCEACQDADGQTWTIQYARDHISEHPNCVRRFAPHFEPGEKEALA